MPLCAHLIRKPIPRTAAQVSSRGRLWPPVSTLMGVKRGSEIFLGNQIANQPQPHAERDVLRLPADEAADHARTLIEFDKQYRIRRVLLEGRPGARWTTLERIYRRVSARGAMLKSGASTLPADRLMIDLSLLHQAQCCSSNRPSLSACQ